MVFDLFFVLFSAIMLWSYQSLDDCIRIRNEAQQMEEWTETGESYKVEQDAVGGYTKGIVVSSICEDFLLKKETWSHSRHCLVCKWLKFFCRILNVTGSPNRTGSNLSILSGKWMWKWAAKLWGGRKWRAPTFFPCTLPLCLLLLATRLWLLSISLKWRAFLQAVTIFIVVRDPFIDMIHNGSVNSKHTHAPKSICQVLTSPLAFDIWAETKLLKSVCSQTCRFQSLLRD